MEFLKLTVCYHCHAIADHLRPDCPHCYEPPFCEKCGYQGHLTKECYGAPYCYHCGEAHPANARICPTYQSKFKAIITEAINSQNNIQLQSAKSTPNSLSQNIPDSWLALTAAVAASLNSTQNPADFLSTLFDILKTSTPNNSNNHPTFSHANDLSLSQESLDLDMQNGSLDYSAQISNQDASLTSLNVQVDDMDLNQAQTTIVASETSNVQLVDKSTHTTEETNAMLKLNENSQISETDNPRPVEDSALDDTEEYILPSDELGWAVFFGFLRYKMDTTELSTREKRMGRDLLHYQSVMTHLPLADQDAIYHRLCSLIKGTMPREGVGT